MDRSSSLLLGRLVTPGRSLFTLAMVAALGATAVNAQSMGGFGRRSSQPQGTVSSSSSSSNSQTPTRNVIPMSPAPVQSSTPVQSNAPILPTRTVQPVSPTPVQSPYQAPTRVYSSAPTEVQVYQRRNNSDSSTTSQGNESTYSTRRYQPSRPVTQYPVTDYPSGTTVRVDGRGNPVSAPTFPGEMQQSGTVRVDGRGRQIGPIYDTTPPANPYAPGYDNDIRVTTPLGQRQYDYHRHRDDYIYGGDGVTIVNNGPVFLGGYYYGNYCSSSYGQYVYPSVYSTYYGFPGYIYTPSVVVLTTPIYPVYETSYLPFTQPSYQVTYNTNNYYVAQESKAADIEAGGERAQKAIKTAYPENSYQAAFADIAHAWSDGNIALLRKHLRDNDTKISILLKKKYTYSIASGDFEQITRDAIDRLSTVSFDFTRLRKAKNGDITAYGKHVYKSTVDASGSDLKADETVPFNQDGPYDKSSDPTGGKLKTIYVSYTLRQHDASWYITMVDSSPTELVPEQAEN